MTYYEILQVSPTASDAVITGAYRALAKLRHPDVGGDPEEFKLIQEAYDHLADKTFKAQYDELLRSQPPEPQATYKFPVPEGLERKVGELINLGEMLLLPRMHKELVAAYKLFQPDVKKLVVELVERGIRS